MVSESLLAANGPHALPPRLAAKEASVEGFIVWLAL